MNKCNENFLIKNGIVKEDICSRIDCRIYSDEDINPIIAKYGFQTNLERKMVSIADIVGYDAEWRGINKANIFLSLDNFFQEGGDGYHSRSLGLLNYNKENIMEELQGSLKNDRINLMETGEGTYIISTNGLHRYTVLRSLYLCEAANANGNKEKLSEIAQKYTIPAEVRKIDVEKTYCKYLLTMVRTKENEKKIKDIETEYDSTWSITGNVVIKYINGDKEVFNKEEFIALTKKRVREDQKFSENHMELQVAYDKYPSFRTFIDKEFSGIIALPKKDIDAKGKEEND